MTNQDQSPARLWIFSWVTADGFTASVHSVAPTRSQAIEKVRDRLPKGVTITPSVREAGTWSL